MNAGRYTRCSTQPVTRKQNTIIVLENRFFRIVTYVDLAHCSRLKTRVRNKNMLNEAELRATCWWMVSQYAYFMYTYCNISQQESAVCTFRREPIFAFWKRFWKHWKRWEARKMAFERDLTVHLNYFAMRDHTDGCGRVRLVAAALQTGRDIPWVYSPWQTSPPYDLEPGAITYLWPL